jgi:outer membrane protein assembly factor BamD (BamD/ComL family)
MFSGNIFSQEYPDGSVNLLLKSGIDDIINQNYSQAKSEFEKLNSKYPDLPFGKIYLAATEIARSYDYGEEYKGEVISKYLNLAKGQSESLLNKNSENIWNHYFLGLTEGYISYYEGLNGSWLTSLKEGINSESNFEECLKRNPDFVEAYSGLGTYKYWKSKKTGFLTWLPFVHDDRAEGINYLEKAVDKSSYNTYLALNSLIWIYIDKKNFDNAVRISEKALKKYPKSRFFRWGLARAYEDLDRSKAINSYYEIMNSYQDLNSMNHYNEIVLKHLIAQQYEKIGEKSKALKLCNEIMAIRNLSEFVKNKLGDRLERVKELQERVLK